MRKYIIGMAVLMLALIACNVSEAKMDELVLSISGVSTSSTSAVTSAPVRAKSIDSIRIDVSATADMDIDITDSRGTVIYSADDVTADATILPQLPLTLATGANLTYVDYLSTNIVYGPIPVVGNIILTAGDEASLTQNVSIAVIYDDGK